MREWSTGGPGWMLAKAFGAILFAIMVAATGWIYVTVIGHGEALAELRAGMRNMDARLMKHETEVNERMVRLEQADRSYRVEVDGLARRLDALERRPGGLR
jgi:hypothetical protein